MLVLSRHPQERLCIGDDIILIVTGIRGDQIKIGIEAPRTVRVIREELKDQAPSERPPKKETKKRTSRERNHTQIGEDEEWWTHIGTSPSLNEATVYYKHPRRRRGTD